MSEQQAMEAARERFIESECVVECPDPELEDAVKSDMRRAFNAGVQYAESKQAADLDLLTEWFLKMERADSREDAERAARSLLATFDLAAESKPVSEDEVERLRAVLTRIANLNDAGCFGGGARDTGLGFAREIARAALTAARESVSEDEVERAARAWNDWAAGSQGAMWDSGPNQLEESERDKVRQAMHIALTAARESGAAT